ncbi:hypothetical protein, partial [Accumulibacter sp.]|uniref:hypothetical protein n=1 Tax=Accumulibacter sp. TaxID=2053492 RepID=UPI002601F129
SCHRHGRFGRSAIGAIDPKLPDDVGKGYGSFVINKLPVKTVDWRPYPRPLRSLERCALNVSCAPHYCRWTGGAEKSLVRRRGVTAN